MTLEAAVPMISDRYPLSPLQQGMLFHYVQRGRSTGVDIEQLEIRLPEALDLDLITNAWRAVAEHHAILRTRFTWDGIDQPQQEVVDRVPFALDVKDLTALSPSDQSSAITTYL